MEFYETQIFISEILQIPWLIHSSNIEILISQPLYYHKI